jgi:hypothetical protein
VLTQEVVANRARTRVQYTNVLLNAIFIYIICSIAGMTKPFTKNYARFSGHNFFALIRQTKLILSDRSEDLEPEVRVGLQ